MDFAVPRDESDRIVLSGQRLLHADFSARHLDQFSSDGCRFEECAFVGTEIRSASFGAGRRVSEYVGCNFDGATLKMGPGGYARFVDCSFEDVVIEGWFCFAVELIRCVFSGRIRKAVFNGTVPPTQQEVIERRINDFEGNDFARAELIDVAFRTGIDLTKQRLPQGNQYVFFDNAADAVGRARRAFEHWGDPAAQKLARGVLVTMEQDVAAGQRQILIRVDDYPRASRSAIRTLLEAARSR